MAKYSDREAYNLKNNPTLLDSFLITNYENNNATNTVLFETVYQLFLGLIQNESSVLTQDNKFVFIPISITIGGPGEVLPTGIDYESEILDKINSVFENMDLVVENDQLIIFKIHVIDYGTFKTHERKYFFPNMFGKGDYSPLSSWINASELEIAYKQNSHVISTPEIIQNSASSFIFNLGDITGQDYLEYINTFNNLENEIGYDLSNPTKIYFFKFIQEDVTYLYYFDSANSEHGFGHYGFGAEFTFNEGELILIFQSNVPNPEIYDNVGVQSVNGDLVDNTDPVNPVVNTPTFEQIYTNTGGGTSIDNSPTSPTYRIDFSPNLIGSFIYGTFSRFGINPANLGLIWTKLLTVGGTKTTYLKATNVVNNVTFELPSKADGTETLAMISDINALLDGVSSSGNTLQKLYNLILGASSEAYVANITARDSYNIPHLPFSIFVIDDGDGRWAKYQATTIGVGASFVKISDPDLLNAVMSASAIKIAYESNTNTNAFTNALLSKLNGIASGATANSSDSFLLNRSNHTGTQTSSTISDFTSAVAIILASFKTANFLDATSSIQGQLNGKQPNLGFTPENISNKVFDLTTNDNTHYPTTQAVQTAINNATIGLLDYRGSYDASTNLFPSTGGSGTAGALLKGDFYICSVAGTLGGVAITAGDLIIALVDSPGQTSTNWNLIQHELNYVAENVANKVTTMTGNTTSDTKYLSAKAIYTWATGLFVANTRQVNSKALTSDITLNTDDIAENGTPTNKWWTNARTIASLLTGFTSGAGTISSSDSVLGAIQKLDGNVGAKQATLTDSVFGTFSNGLTAKTTPVDTDTINLTDSADSNKSKKLSWANLKATLKSYFDGLYSPLFYNYKSTTPSSTLTGTLTETQLLQITIPANTFSANDFLKIPSLTFVKSGTNGGVVFKVKLSTSATMPSGTTGQIATYSAVSTTLFFKLSRLFSIASGNILGYGFTTSVVSDVAVLGSTISSQAFDRTQTQYLYVSATLANVSDSIYLNDIQVTNM